MEPDELSSTHTDDFHVPRVVVASIVAIFYGQYDGCRQQAVRFGHRDAPGAGVCVNEVFYVDDVVGLELDDEPGAVFVRNYSLNMFSI